MAKASGVLIFQMTGNKIETQEGDDSFSNVELRKMINNSFFNKILIFFKEEE